MSNTTPEDDEEAEANSFWDNLKPLEPTDADTWDTHPDRLRELEEEEEE